MRIFPHIILAINKQGHQRVWCLRVETLLLNIQDPLLDLTNLLIKLPSFVREEPP